MSEENITQGSLVRLKSGSPVMSLASISDEVATCQWFDGKMIQSQKCHINALEIFTKPKPKPVVPKVVTPQTKFKTGDKVRARNGSPDMVLGEVPPDATLNDQVECLWTQAAQPATDKTPATPEMKHAPLFFLHQLILLNS